MYYFHLYAVRTVFQCSVTVLVWWRDLSGVGKESMIQYAWACEGERLPSQTQHLLP